ncbi:ribosome maturation factor RimM [Granulicella sibirica]|uniref:Ribosome maturation factor RimM n=1 Tax=Granulicella sibirica TaxID=2479048 RepID=A0A4Q0SY57_9BACT|nr:ribosome maturation factor RimM [Granulicella sibirica]RXH54920.1 16S rRNA processing protein RimM [Granulicella sibirica]
METTPTTATDALNAPQASSWLLLAHILRPQGRKGEVLADLFTDFPERFDGEPRVFLAKPGFTGPASEARPATITSFFLPVGKNSGRIVLHLAGIDSITQAETLANLEVIVPHEERLEAEEDASYISDLLDCQVYDVPDSPDQSPVFIGTVDDVHLPTTPDGARRLEEAAPLLAVLSPSGNEILIPFVKAYLLSIDADSKRILMRLPPGLLEVNA